MFDNKHIFTADEIKQMQGKRPLTTGKLMDDIVLLLDEHLVCHLFADNSKAVVELANGQRFKITVEEMKRSADNV